MKLHKDKTLFKQAIRATAEKKGLPEIYIEKDYWVTLVLYTIFNHPIGAETVFKGGTALSKCYGMIERFSEDIDLIVMRKEGESSNKLTNKLKHIGKVVSDVLPEVEIEGITNKMGMNRKTAHSYSKEFQGDYGQVKDVVVLEATWLGFHEPFTTQKLSSYIHDMMQIEGQTDMIKKYSMEPFDLFVLGLQRTLCEKIMSLVRFSYTENPIIELKKKIRHTYDIHCMIQNDKMIDFFRSVDFDNMMLKVANDDIISYKNKYFWLNKHPKDALIFSNPEEIWHQIKDEYSGEFKNLVFGVLPDETKIKESLILVSKRLEQLKWN